MTTVGAGILPAFVAGADWSASPAKRQVARARRVGEGFVVESLDTAPDEAPWREGVRAALGLPPDGGPALVGFDFPIGVPRAYAAAADIETFGAFLPAIGRAPWDRFSQVCERAEDISLHRPFYPSRPGGTSRAQLVDGLGLLPEQLRRRCDGRDAEALFWTLGGKQAGKAALAGWRMFNAAPLDGRWCWPFHGGVHELLAETDDGGVVVAETYPREFYGSMGARRGGWSKRRRSDRAALAPGILSWAARLGVRLEPHVLALAESGFGSDGRGEDQFDALVGLLGVIAVAVGERPSGEPRDDPAVTSVEGWILGRAAEA